ncbi:MAG: DUF1838 family protein [Lewinellaceae bacterium]|nr:DUF1838 family protein [Saprospiraceae bacterium]MCB9336943.1 DUF1838 family protein [Lewinellaceae bacterium]
MKLSAAIFSLAFLATSCTTNRAIIDFTRGSDQLGAYLKVRLSLDSSEVVFYWAGAAYAFIPGQPTKKLFDFEGYNIAKAVKTAEGYDQLAREVMVFKDTGTGRVLDSWPNPYTGDTVEVFQIWNDPANVRLRQADFDAGKLPVHFTRMGDGQAGMYVDGWIAYPSPLPKKDFPENSRSDLYQAGELFSFFFNEKDLRNRKMPSIPCHFSWTRISDFMPWMRMADRPGHIVFVGRGYKLPDGFGALPDALKDYVLQQQPLFAKAPDSFSAPNMSSWKYFKKIMGERAAAKH